MTPHIHAQKEQIANTVLMPGDPLRAKFIAETFFENAELVNSVRNILAYTGTYKGKRITTMASGMGIPSMGIYSYELFKIYDVSNIIRIGSCGTYSPDLKLFDTILVDNVYSESNYSLMLCNEDCHLVQANLELNTIIEQTASEINIPYVKGNTLCNDTFDAYMPDVEALNKRMPKDFNSIGSEMEAFSLFYNAKLLGKRASCLLSVVDSHYSHENATSTQRETALKEMITLALESSIKLN